MGSVSLSTQLIEIKMMESLIIKTIGIIWRVFQDYKPKQDEMINISSYIKSQNNLA